MDAGDDKAAAIWLSIACGSASDFGPFGELASAELEEKACRIVRRLPVPAPRDYVHPPRRWMHVVTEVYSVFGHSALIRRWIEQDDSSCIHDIIATGQGPAFPDSLQVAVARTGGEVTCLDRTLPEVARALLLRQAAWDKADVIVLHTHPFDIIPSIAFGVAGGPPALAGESCRPRFLARRVRRRSGREHSSIGPTPGRGLPRNRRRRHAFDSASTTAAAGKWRGTG